MIKGFFVFDVQLNLSASIAKIRQQHQKIEFLNLNLKIK